MSKAVAKTSKPQASFDLIESTLFEGQLSPFVLDSSAPMPLGFGEKWTAKSREVVDAVKSNKDGAMETLAVALGLPTRLVKPAAKLGKSSFHTSPVVFAVTGGVIAEVASIAGGVMNMEPVNAAMFMVLMPIFGIQAGLFSWMFAHMPAERFRYKFEPFIAALQSGYEQRVIEWAQARYGVTIPAGAWASPIDRVSKDIVYLGVKDGESVYCFETEAGWVLGHRDGTELPVLVEDKELVSA